MKDLLLAAALAAACTSPAFAADADACTPSNIKRIADEEGLNKARALSSECISKGYLSAKESAASG